MLIFTRIIILVLLLLSANRLHAQQSSDEKLDVVRVNTNLVLIPVSVYDQHGARVSGLNSRDFALSFNEEPVPITHFSAGTERVSMAFVLDASGSSREIIARQQDTALALYSRFGHESKVAVIRFSDRPEVIVPFTQNIEHARRAFSFPALRNRKTAIFDAVKKGIDLFESADPTKSTGALSFERRIIILISDG
ncbi:MAG: VWA domain-containing protein, partial [Pyrinomonadaceae bacterium]